MASPKRRVPAVAIAVAADCACNASAKRENPPADAILCTRTNIRAAATAVSSALNCSRNLPGSEMACTNAVMVGSNTWKAETKKFIPFACKFSSSVFRLLELIPAWMYASLVPSICPRSC